MSVDRSKMPINQQGYKRKSTILFVVAVSITIILLIIAGPGLWSALLPAWLAAAFAYALFPIVKAIEKKLPRVWAVAIVLLTLVAIVASALIWLIPLAIEQASELFKNMPSYIDNLQTHLPIWQKSLDSNSIPIDLQTILNSVMSKLGEYSANVLPDVVSVASLVISFVVALFLTPLYMFYYLFERDRFINGILYLVPSHMRPVVRNIGHSIHDDLGKFFRAQLVIATISGILTTIAYFIVGQEFAILFGIIMGVLSIFPYIGPVLGAIPPILVSLLAGNMQWLTTLLAILIVQQLLGTLIAPRVLGKEVQIHPVYILTALLLGAYFAGIIGALLSIPITLIIVAIFREILAYTVEIKQRSG